MASDIEIKKFVGETVMPTYAALQAKVEALQTALTELQDEVALLQESAPQHFTAETNPETGKTEIKPKKRAKKED